MNGRDLLPLLQEMFPTAGLTFGYIGNCGPNGEGYENLSWHFFTKLPKVSDGFYNNAPSVPVADPKDVNPAYAVRALCRITGRKLTVSENQVLNHLLAPTF